MTRAVTRQIMKALARFVDDDNVHVIVACNRLNAPAVMFDCPGARLLFGSGPDAADLALIAVIEHEGLAARFDEVIIASGDGIFAGYAAQLAAADVRVTALVGNGRLSNKLRLAAHDVNYLWGESAQLSTANTEVS